MAPQGNPGHHLVKATICNCIVSWVILDMVSLRNGLRAAMILAKSSLTPSEKPVLRLGGSCSNIFLSWCALAKKRGGVGRKRQRLAEKGKILK